MVTEAQALEIGYKYAPVLARMVELLGQDDLSQVKFGEALDQAAREYHLEVPADVQMALLRAAFKILATGRLEGCPDA